MQNSTQPVSEEFILIDTTPITEKTPVIRVDRNGKILFANQASRNFLDSLFKLGDFIPKDFIQRIPGMLNLNADFSVPVVVSSKTMIIDVIGFEECGYIGLYGR